MKLWWIWTIGHNFKGKTKTFYELHIFNICMVGHLSHSDRWVWDTCCVVAHDNTGFLPQRSNLQSRRKCAHQSWPYAGGNYTPRCFGLMPDCLESQHSNSVGQDKRRRGWFLLYLSKERAPNCFFSLIMNIMLLPEHFSRYNGRCLSSSSCHHN